MNVQQLLASRRPRAATLIVAALLAATLGCSGGGGGDSSSTFTLQFVDPNASADVNGGDTVVVHGTNFLAARVARVFFGANNPGFGIKVLSDTEIEVTVPPAPSGNAGTYSVEVETLEFGTKGLFRAFTYADDGGGTTGPPVPTTIFPTSFTATGAESFTISGTNLGPSGGQVDVIFEGVGLVRATVSQDRQFATGNAPVSQGVPIATPILVTVDNSGQSGPVPTQVTYNYAAPSSWLVPFQEGAGNTSLPVRVGEGIAVVATSGTTANWGNVAGTGDDELFLITGPPLTAGLVPLFGNAGLPASQRRLDSNNSVPVAVDSDTVCLYSPGMDGIALTGDEVIIVVSGLQSTPPTVRVLPVPNLTPAPIARISDTQIAFTTRLTGTAAAQDELRFASINSGVPTLSGARTDIGLADGRATVGRGYRSIPFSPDGDAVFVFTLHPGGGTRTFGDSTDLLTRYQLSTGAVAQTPAPFLHDTPIALSATRVVAAAQSVASPPNPDDKLAIYDFAGGSFTTTYMGVGARIQTLGLRTIVALGDGHVALAHGGANQTAGNADDQIAVFRDDGSGSLTQLNVPLAGRPQMTPLGDGSVVVFGPGGDLFAGTLDDRAILLRANGSSFAEFPGAPTWGQGTLAAVDSTRVFAIGTGPDAPNYGTGNETLIVLQAKAVGLGIATSLLPMSGALGYFVNAAPSQAAQARTPFVPVGSGWGLMQSPGTTNAFSSAGNRVLIVSY